MTQYLPGNLLALFTARPPIPFKPPVDRLKKRKNQVPYSPVSTFMKQFEAIPPPPATRGETREEQTERKKGEKKSAADSILDEKLVKWDPHADKNASGDPFKTLFVARINYDTTESKLRRELESYGTIRQINMVFNIRSRKPRGYAFVEYEHERDMHSAYKHADGKKIDGRRILVDVERGRTVKSWRPRRLGGGLGGTRRGGPDDNIRHSGRVEQWESTGGGRDRGERSERGEKEPREDKPRKRSRSPRERRDRDRDRERGERRRERDRGDREGGRAERPERDGREERERGERGEREDRPERPEREDRPEEGERDDRERGEVEEGPEAMERGEREREERRMRAERDREDRPERGGERDREDRPERGGERDREDRPERGGEDEAGERERKERRRRDRERRDRDRDRDRDRGERRGRDRDRGDAEREGGERDRDRDRSERDGERDRDGEDREGADRERDAGDRERERERERDRERERYRQSRDEGELPPDDYPSDSMEQSGNDMQMNRFSERGGPDERNGEHGEFMEGRGDINERMDDPSLEDERLRFDAKEKLAYPAAVYE